MDEKSKEISKHSTGNISRSSGIQPGRILDAALSDLSDKQRSELFAKAQEEALRLEIQAKEAELNYIAGRKDVDNHIDSFNSLTRNSGNTEKHRMKTTAKTATGNTTIESSSGSLCFVATTAFGDKNNQNVIFLRNYRDLVLKKTHSGRKFINWYYRNGPKIANFIENKIVLRTISRIILKLMVRILRVWHAIY